MKPQYVVFILASLQNDFQKKRKHDALFLFRCSHVIINISQNEVDK